MYFNYTKLMLANTMMIGVIMTICSNNWLSMWMGLELSLLSFIPFMQTENSISSESMIKYFIIQSIASTLFLFSTAIMLIGVNMMENFLISVAMLIKLGSAPFHNWVIILIESLSFYTIFSLLTILKIPPLIILYQINSKFIILPIIIGMFISSLCCLNQTSMRKTLGYSSIYNISVMISVINMNSVIWIYMIIYSMIMFSLIFLMKSLKISFINQMVMNDYSTWMKLMVWVNMLSMSGFPPLMGFFNKIMVIQLLIFNNYMVISSILMMTSMMVTMFYVRLTFNCMLNTNSFKKWNNFNNNYHYTIMTFNLFLVPLVISLNELY